MIDGLAERFLAAGAYAAILPAGAWIALRAFPRIAVAAPREGLAAALCFGIGLWSLLDIAAAVANGFSPRLNGAAGWAMTVGAIWQMRGDKVATQWLRTLRSQPHMVIAAGIAVFALGYLYLGFPHESPLADRDEGIYTLTALALERTGGLAVSPPNNVIDLASDLFSLSTDGERSLLPGIYKTTSGFVLRFSPLLPAWIAQAHAAFGDAALYRTSGLLALASLTLFYAIARRLFPGAIALLCTAVFALNPAQVWIARINLAESLGQLLVLAAVWLSIRALGATSRRSAIAAGILFGLSALARLEMVLIAPLITAAAATATLWIRRGNTRIRDTFVMIAVATIFSQGAAVVALALATPGYVEWNQNVLWVAGFAAVAAAAFMFLSIKGQLEFLRTRTAIAALSAACTIVLAALFVYAAWWRPEHPPFMTMSMPPGHPWDGQRDWREQSLVNLAEYLGWPTLALALVGAVFTAIRILRGRASPALVLLWMIVVPVAITLLANPRVSPDQFWAIRRFVPIAIPGAILLAGVGFQFLVAHYSWRNRRAFAGILAIVAGMSLLAAQRSTLFVRENRGLTPQIGEIAATTARGSLVVVRDFDSIAASLLVGFGQPVVPLRDDTASVDSSGRAFWSLCKPATPCMLVHYDYSGLSGLALGSTEEFVLTRDYIAPTFSGLPNTRAHDAKRVLVTAVTGLAPVSDLRLTGAYRNWNVDDSGFYREELGRDWSWRWTDGQATLWLPSIAADRLEIALAISEHRATHTSIAIDGALLQDGPLTPGIARLIFPIAGPPAVHELTIRSDTFVPKEDAAVSDDRRLGIAVLAVRLLDSSTPRLGRNAAADSYRAEVSLLGGRKLRPISIAAGAVSSVTLQVANKSAVIWPAASEARSDEPPVAIGITWAVTGDIAPRLEQRINLPFSLHPGERLMLAPPLDPGTLPPGKYEVRIGLVHEGVTWFAQRSGALIRVPVTIEAR